MRAQRMGRVRHVRDTKATTKAHRILVAKACREQTTWNT